jgi:hypothetical protein
MNDRVLIMPYTTNLSVIFVDYFLFLEHFSDTAVVSYLQFKLWVPY